MMRIVRTRAEAREAVAEARRSGARVALVPTMGYLHEGHLSLVDRARARAEFVAMSIFVNPLQFGAGEDLDRYPRDLERDAALAAERGVDLLFAPSPEEMYPAGEPIVRITPGPLADRLCGLSRPGHFEGVLTVVGKLFHVFWPDVAVFGQKDFQQALLIRRMVRDLDFPVEIDVAPIVREADGLAMSSRNVYLDDDERARARAISAGLDRALDAFRSGVRDGARILAAARETIAATPRLRIEYLELVHPDTLEPVATAEAGCVVAVAAHVGRTRLIDNVILE